MTLFAIAAMALISGMLGIGVAFAAIPILSLNGMDLVHQVQPIALFLNGVTALCSAVSFGRAGYIEPARSAQLAAVATVFSPLGAVAALHTSEPVLWGCYFVTVAATLYFLQQRGRDTGERLPFLQVLALAAPISALSGLLGVGAGFLLVPVMIFAGFTVHRAAAMNSVAVIPASFASLVPHVSTASVSAASALPIVFCAALGALFGGFLSARLASEKALRRLFIAVMVALAGYKLVTLVFHGQQPSLATGLCVPQGLLFVDLKAQAC
jgi:hypothetical protein